MSRKKGFKLSPEHKKKIALALRCNKNTSGLHWKWNNESREKRKKQWVGKTWGEKTQFKKGQKAWNYGKKCSRSTIRKISLSLLGKIGSLSRNWQGGKSFEPYTPEWNKELKERIKKIDNHKCRLCGEYGNIVHHIDYDKKNCNSANLITLCIKCHGKTNNNREYFSQILKKKRRD